MRKQAGFIPGMVMEINVAIAILGVAAAVLLSWAQSTLRPQLVAANPAELAAPAPGTKPVAPEGWTVTQAPDGAVVIHRSEPIGLRWVVPGLLALTLVACFVFPLHPAFWALLAVVCGISGYANSLDPVEQSIAIGADGSLALRGSARLTGIIVRPESIAAKDIDTVLVHKERPEAHIVYFIDKTTRRGWRVYADSAADANALAALTLAQLRNARKN